MYDAIGGRNYKQREVCAIKILGNNQYTKNLTSSCLLPKKYFPLLKHLFESKELVQYILKVKWK